MGHVPCWLGLCWCWYWYWSERSEGHDQRNLLTKRKNSVSRVEMMRKRESEAKGFKDFQLNDPLNKPRKQTFHHFEGRRRQTHRLQRKRTRKKIIEKFFFSIFGQKMKMKLWNEMRRAKLDYGHVGFRKKIAQNFATFFRWAKKLVAF